MSRTAGAVSNVAIHLSDLFTVLGIADNLPPEAKNRKIVVSAKWLTMQQKPCELVTITADELERLNAGLGERVASIAGEHATNTAPPVIHRAHLEDIPEL